MFSVNLFDHLRPILTWRIRKSGLDKAKMNISVANSVLNAHIRCFHQLVARRRRKKQTMVVYGYISGFCWVNINNGNPFYHSDCVTAPNTVGFRQLGPRIEHKYGKKRVFSCFSDCNCISESHGGCSQYFRFLLWLCLLQKET